MEKVVLIAGLLLVACGDESKSKRADAQSVNEVQSIRVEPELLTIITGPDAAGQQDFDAFAVFTDGTETPLEVVSWEVSNKSSGTIDEAGRFTASSANGGETWITATLDDVEGKATVTVRYVDEVNDEGIDPSIFDRPEYESEVSSWVYPPQGVSLPRNTPSILWQWDDPGPLQPYGSPAEAYRLKFNSSQTQITWYTSSLDLLLDETTWASIASTNAGGTVEVELSAALYDKVIVQEPLEVNVQRLDATGSVIYWSITQQGLVEIPFGSTATDLITSAGADRLLSMDLHAGQLQGFFNIPVDNLYATRRLLEAVRTRVSGEGGARVDFHLVDAPVLRERDPEAFSRLVDVGPEGFS